MKYKVGDKVRVRIDLVPYERYGNLTFLSGNMSKCAGQICTIKEVLGDEKYYVSENPFAWSEEMLEPVAPTLAEIKERKLTCVIHVKSKKDAIMLVEILGVDEERLYDKNDFIECWDGHKENTCYRIRNGKVDQMDCVKFYQKIDEEIYELPEWCQMMHDQACAFIGLEDEYD